ncbi:S53 family peptidase [Candidatus Microgenomates bacterium]|nr:S53 family peptidase [Candidatus Microgenomates bacterium]
MSQKGFAQLFLLFLLLTGILATIYLVKQDTSSSRPQALTPKQLPEQSQAVQHIPVCPPFGRETPRCHARVVINQQGRPIVDPFPNGLGPAQFKGAYNLTGSSSGRILAIVSAFDHPNIKSDLDTYSNAFSIAVLPECSGPISSSTDPCFQKVDQNGGTNYPTTVDGTWALETALDVEVAHGICQDCKILLVEANSNTYQDLTTAIDRAIAMGANVVSGSWGSSEFSSETTFDSHFNIPGVAFTFSSGDSGYGTIYPAASRYVTAVGGTTLRVNADNSYGSETAWSGSGSGCSTYESKPSWQKDTGCQKRTIADVSAVADPSTAAAVYSSVPYSGQTGWFKVGGTSLSAPIIAGVYALKGIPAQVAANSLPYLNSPSTNLRDITSGSNGGCLKKTKYLCTAVSGYDGPTGLGTPKGINAF